MKLLLSSIIVALLVAACGGGGGGSIAPLPATGSSSPTSSNGVAVINQGPTQTASPTSSPSPSPMPTGTSVPITITVPSPLEISPGSVMIAVGQNTVLTVTSAIPPLAVVNAQCNGANGETSPTPIVQAAFDASNPTTITLTGETAGKCLISFGNLNASQLFYESVTVTN